MSEDMHLDELEARGKALLEQIGRATSSELRDGLMRLRDAADERILEGAISRIDAALARSADEGWCAWLEALGGFLGEFKHRASEALCARPFPFADSRQPEVDKLGRATAWIRQSRWDDVYPAFEFLASQDCIKGLARARLVMIQGQIQHYRFGNTTAARRLIERAVTLAPADALIQAADGDLWLEQRDPEKASDCYDRAIKVESLAACGYVGHGDIALRENHVDDAERWFRKAVELAPGETLGYNRLQSMFGRPELLEKSESDFTWALEHRIALDAEAEYDAYLEAGASFLEIRDYANAEKWYRKAEALEPSWPRAYVSLAEVRGRQERYDDAIELCRKAIELSPDYSDGYVYLSDIYTLANRRTEAVRVYTEMPESVRHMGAFLRKESNFHNALGNLYYNFDNNDLAVQEYRQAIAEAPSEATYHRNLARALQDQRKYADAEAACRRAFELDGDRKQLDGSLANIANEQGNAEYSAGRYQAAVEYYRRAVELQDSEAVFHGNLGGAWELIAQSGNRKFALAKAIESFEKADDLSRRAEWTDKVLRLRNRLEVARACGDAALDRACVVTPIAVEVASDLVPLVAGTVENTLSKSLLELVESMRRRILDACGVALPGVRFRENEGDLAAGSYVILLNEVPLVLGHVDRDRVFASGAREDLSKVTSDEPSMDPVCGRDGLWLAEGDLTPQSSAALQVLQPMEYMMRHVENVLRSHLADFVGHQEVQALLKSQASAASEAAKSPPADLTALTTICRALLAEEVPIRPFEGLHECVVRSMAEGTPLRDIVERIRSLETIRERLPGNDGGRRILAAGANFEKQIGASLYSTGGSVVLAIEPEPCQQLLSAVRDKIDALPAVLVVRDPKLRPYVRKLIESEFPQLPVLSRAELLADFVAANVTTIDIDAPAKADVPRVRTRRAADAYPPEPQATGVETPPDIVVATSRQFPDQASLGDEQPIEGLFGQMQDGLFYELGIILPTVRRDDDDTRLAPREFRLRIDAVDHGTRTGLEPNEFLVNDTPERLHLLGLTGEKAANPASGTDNSKVRETGTQLQACHLAGLTTWGPAGFLVLALSAELRKTAARFQTDTLTRFCLDSVRDDFPALVDRVLERYPLPKITGVLRALLQEEISVRDLRAVLEGLLALNGTTDADGSRYILFTANTDNPFPSAKVRAPDQLSVAQLADFVRTTLKRYISHKYTRGRSTLTVLLLDSTIEERLSTIASHPLSVEERERLLAAIEQEWKNSRDSSPAILTIMEIRRSLRNLLRPRFPDLAVLAFQELSPELNVQPLARISMPAAAG